MWLAQDDALGSPVAIKVLADNWARNLDVRARFVEEARILRRADHDRLVRVYDIAELDDGRPYFVMSFADRGTLAERIAAYPNGMALPVVVHVVSEIAKGLWVMHRMGVVHRDLKPSNVLFSSVAHHQRNEDASELGAGERVLLADLGLAKALATASGFTLAAGSPAYCAPEQRSMSAGIDVRADVYALGVIAFELLTGRTPEAAGLKIDDPSQRADLERVLVAQRPDAGPAVASVVRQATEHEPARRFADVGSFAAALAAAATPTSPPPDSTGPPDDRRSHPTRGAARPAAHGPGHDRTRGRAIRSAVVAAVAFLVAAAVVVVALLPGSKASSSVRVESADGKVAVSVPKAWAEDLRGNAWRLDDFGLGGRSASGVTASPDIGRWSEPRAPTPGVFVGASTELARRSTPTALLDRRRHVECRSHARRTLRTNALSGLVEHWTGCAGSISWDEAALDDGRGGPLVYAQVKSVSDADRRGLEHLLDSIRVTGRP